MSNLRAEVEKIAGGRMSVVFDAVSLSEETTEGRTVVHGVVRFPMNVALGKESYKVLLALFKSGDITCLKVEVPPVGLGSIVLEPNQLIGDILVEAENLKEINLERFHPCLKRDPRIGSALRAISHLINIRLSTLGDDAITDVLQHMKGDAIERLTLSYHVYDDFPLPEQPKSLPPLLSALSSFRNLHTVKLWNFTPAVAPLQTSSYGLLPSIRYLRLSETSAPALHMVEVCPNLSTLIFSIDREESEPTPIVGSRWPALRRLMLTDLNEADCVSSRLGTVDQLQIADTVSLVIPMSFTQESSTTRLLRLLRITSPVSLYLSFLRVADEDRLSFRMFWREAASMISRLRSLELKLARNISEARRDFEWLRELPDTLSPLSISCLRILVPETSLPLWATFNTVRSEQIRSSARDEEVARVRTLAELPHLVVDAIPTVRYLAIGDLAPNRALFTDAHIQDERLADVFADAPKEESIVSEWDDLRRVQCVRKQTWWRIEEREGSRVLVEISEEEGEEAQREIEAGGYDDDEQIRFRLTSLSL
ncbi:hypothetical protein C8Q76DRAFT_800398 [Earliella scabrosa]|nr:hypothetical protein C8Q76DRAFT_800398 [Earliella scabrosa]